MSSPPDDPITPRHRHALVVMARVPRAGECKTRLCPPLTPAEAADLYRAFLEDVARDLSAWSGPADLWVAWAGRDGDEHVLRAIVGPAFRLLRQRGETLTDRMEDVFRRMMRAGYQTVAMRNSDSPHLPMSLLEDAFAALEAAPRGKLVLGPDLDGGYYLVGVDVEPTGVFPKTMSTSSVFEQTTVRAKEVGLAVTALPRFLDVDTADDLALLWLEFGNRADVRESSTWKFLNDSDIIRRLESYP